MTTSPTPQPATPDTPADDAKSSPMWLILGAVIVVITLGIIADSFVHVERNDAPEKLADGTYDAQVWGPAQELSGPEDVGYLARRLPTDPFAMGVVDAPVTVVEFSDFECPFCAKFANEVEPELIDKYINTGKVRFEWNDFPVNGDTAVAAAKAGRAAAEQGRFNEFRKELFAASAGVKGHPNNTIDDFVAFAEAAGVPDIDKFTKDATSDKYDEAVEDAFQWGQALGVSGTPTVIVGGSAVEATPEALSAAIEAQLKAIDDGTLTPTEPGTTDGRDIKEKLLGN